MNVCVCATCDDTVVGWPGVICLCSSVLNGPRDARGGLLQARYRQHVHVTNDLRGAERMTNECEALEWTGRRGRNREAESLTGKERGQEESCR